MVPDWGSPSDMRTGQGAVTILELQGEWVPARELPGTGNLTRAQGQDRLCSRTVTRLETQEANVGLLLVEGMS
jgi:hypothetical protein